MFVMFDETRSISKSTGGLVGYDDWFTPSRSGVRSSPEVYFCTNTAFCDQALKFNYTNDPSQTNCLFRPFPN